MTIRRTLMAVAATAPLLAVARFLWVDRGGTLPDDRLRIGMTKAEARAVTGPPQSISPDGSSWTVTRPGSSYWLDLTFGADDRLVFFRRDCF